MKQNSAHFRALLIEQSTHKQVALDDVIEELGQIIEEHNLTRLPHLLNDTYS